MRPKNARERREWIDADQDWRAAGVPVHPKAVIALARTIGVLHSEPSFRVMASVLEHRTPCLGFAIEETAHANVWKSRLSELGLQVGSWLRELKRAVIENRRDDYPIQVGLRSNTSNERVMLLRELRSAVTVTPGQKIGYVTDVADTPANRQAIIQLVRNADLLFIEAAFAEADVALAAERAHLTTAAAGSIAREAAVRRVEPFHFSVGICPRCHTIGRSFDQIGKKCTRPLASGGKCPGVIRSALAADEWTECADCHATGRQDGGVCSRCNGEGWLHDKRRLAV